MSTLIKPFHLTPFEKNINGKANVNWDDTISYVNDRNNGTEKWDDIRWAHYGCRVYNNANISVVTSGVSQALTFNSERYDDLNMHDTTLNTSRLIAPRDGVYNIFGHIEYDSNATGQRFAIVSFNGTKDIAISSMSALGGGYATYCSVATNYFLQSGEYVELLALQTSGGSLNVLASSDRSPEFGMFYVGE